MTPAAPEIPHQEAATIRHALATALCAACLAIAAQTLPAQTLSVGGRLGVAGSAVLFEDQESNDFKQPLPGLQIGGFVAYAAGCSRASAVWRACAARHARS